MEKQNRKSGPDKVEFEDLIHEIADDSSIHRATVRVVCRSMVELVRNHIETGQCVNIERLGVFGHHATKARVIDDVNTPGRLVYIPKRWRPKWFPDKRFAERVSAMSYELPEDGLPPNMVLPQRLCRYRYAREWMQQHGVDSNIQRPWLPKDEYFDNKKQKT